jgi:biopolymer transport protein ExbB
LGTQYQLLNLFADGGFMMYPLLLCSLIALGVIIAKAWTLFIAHRKSAAILATAEDLTTTGNVGGALDEASVTPGPAAAIVTAGLRRIRRGSVADGELEQAISTTGTIELGFLERGLVILATIANVAPLMGFLGTVAGMILAFGAIEAAGEVDPALVAGGIKVALLTTATGLAIAIPVNIAYNFFVTRIDTLIVDMETGANRVLKLAWNMERDGKLEVVKAVKSAIQLDAREVAAAPTARPMTAEERRDLGLED